MLIGWLLVVYLALLGLAALFRPALALMFLSAFARSRRVNAAEAGARGLVGFAFIILDPGLGWRGIGLLLGVFLLLTSVLMLIFPEQHRRLAPRLVGSISRFMLPFGLSSLGLALFVALALLDLSAGGRLDFAWLRS